MNCRLILCLLICGISVFSQGMRQCTYEVSGSANWANLTLRNKDGATEQKQVSLPYRDDFFTEGGAMLYLSAQKVKVTKKERSVEGERIVVLADGESGDVHVLIRVNGRIVQQATSSAPFGIATVSGKAD